MVRQFLSDGPTVVHFHKLKVQRATNCRATPRFYYTTTAKAVLPASGFRYIIVSPRLMGKGPNYILRCSVSWLLDGICVKKKCYERLKFQLRKCHGSNFENTAPVGGCDNSSLPYQDALYNRIVADTGDVYKVSGWVFCITFFQFLFALYNLFRIIINLLFNNFNRKIFES